MRIPAVSMSLLGVVLAFLACGTTSTHAQSLRIVQTATNPATGSSYALLEADTWTACQDDSVLYGGNLVTVNDVAENDWIKATFPVVDTWIGLNDLAVEGVYEWISGQTSTYTDWAAGEPNNSGDYIYFWVAGSPTSAWDDTTVAGGGDNFGLCEIEPCGVTPPTGITGATVGGDLELTFTNNGPYPGGIDVYRDGFFVVTIADPAATNFIDIGVPCAGVYEYILRGNDGAGCTAFSDNVAIVHGVCTPPTNLTADDVGGAVELTWDNGGSVYTSIDILRGGVVIDTLVGSPSSYTDTPPPGVHQYEVTGSDMVAIPCCVATSATAGIVFELTDLIWRAEGVGLVQSADMLEQTLIALGRSPVVVDDLASCFCLAGASLDVPLWACLGTWPNHHCLSDAEADILVSRMEAGGNIFIEGGDIWGFCAATS